MLFPIFTGATIHSSDEDEEGRRIWVQSLVTTRGAFGVPGYIVICENPRSHVLDVSTRLFVPLMDGPGIVLPRRPEEQDAFLKPLHGF